MRGAGRPWPRGQCSQVPVLAPPTLGETPGLPGTGLRHLQLVGTSGTLPAQCVRVKRGDTAKVPLTPLTWREPSAGGREPVPQGQVSGPCLGAEEQLAVFKQVASGRAWQALTAGEAWGETKDPPGSGSFPGAVLDHVGGEMKPLGAGQGAVTEHGFRS